MQLAVLISVSANFTFHARRLLPRIPAIHARSCPCPHRSLRVHFHVFQPYPWTIRAEVANKEGLDGLVGGCADWCCALHPFYSCSRKETLELSLISMGSYLVTLHFKRGAHGVRYCWACPRYSSRWGRTLLYVVFIMISSFKRWFRHHGIPSDVYLYPRFVL